jgi:pterin-4a-carbinolamine dehydratase
VRLSTHDSGGKVTAKDVELARRMDKLTLKSGNLRRSED